MVSVNHHHAIYSGVRGGVTITIPIALAPIMISPEEMGVPRDPSQLRIERQDWVAEVKELGSLYPPLDGDKIIAFRGSEFRVKSMGMEEPCYSHTTSTRDRVLIHSIRTKVPNA